MELIDRIRGGLFGVAAGDALGGTTEFMSPAEIRSKYGYLEDIVGGGIWRLEPGEVTDDTMMTLCVAEGLLERPDDPENAIGERFLAWYRSNPKDVGNIVRAALGGYRGDWREASRSAHLAMGRSAGNGSLMRTLPVALLYRSDEDIDRFATLQSRMTHEDELADEACRLYCRIAGKLLRGEAMAGVLAESRYERYLSEKPDFLPDGYVVHTFAWVIRHLAVGDSFQAVVTAAANGGGDSDTVGAIAGGLAGIHYGASGIPGAYRDILQIRDRLERTAQALCDYRLAAG